MKIIGLLTVLILLSGCFLFSPAGKDGEDSTYTERISRPRTERQLQREELVLALHNSIESSGEVNRLRQVLDKEKIKLKIIVLPDRDLLSSLVRSGRADVMAGAFTREEICSLHLLPVLSYQSSDKKNQFCFAVRHDDHILETLLGAAADPETTEERKDP